jgi:hypothetical protein
MSKATHHLGSVDSLNPHRWRGKWPCHHGDGVWKVVRAFCAVSQLMTCQSGFLYVKNVPQHNLKMRLKVLLFVPHWRAPHLVGQNHAASSRHTEYDASIKYKPSNLHL